MTSSLPVSKFGGAGARTPPTPSLAVLKAVKNNFQSKSRTFALREKTPHLSIRFFPFSYTQTANMGGMNNKKKQPMPGKLDETLVTRKRKDYEAPVAVEQKRRRTDAKAKAKAKAEPVSKRGGRPCRRSW